MGNIENRQKIITIGQTDILDISKYSQKRKFYALTADVFDGAGEKVDRQTLLKDVVFSKQESTEFIKRAKVHVSNIVSIQKENGGRLENVQLFNISVQEAVQKGLIHEPAVLQHIPS